MGRFNPYTALIRGERHLVRAAEPDEPGNFTLVFGDSLVPIDDPCDLLAVVEPGEQVTADFGSFQLTVWRAEDGRLRHRASADSVEGPVDTDDERACWGLLARLGDERSPKACFFCRWSEIEPSTGWGNLGCAIAHAEAYHQVATSPDQRTRKFGAYGMFMHSWVDEWHSCDRFEVRPLGYGYRGRPR